MRSLVVLICVSFQAFVAFASVQGQGGYADSLKRLLEQTVDHDTRIHLLGQLSDYYSYSDSAKAMDYAWRIKKLAQSKGDQRGVGIAHYRAGGVFLELYQLDSAIRQYEEATRILTEDTSRLGQQILARVWHNHGAVYQRKGDADTYLDMLLHQAIPIQQHLGDSIGMGRNFFNIGNVFQNTKDYAKAADYYQRSIEMLTPYPGVPELPDAYIKSAEILSWSGNRDRETRSKSRAALQTADSLLKRHPDPLSMIYLITVRGRHQEIFVGDLEKALDYYLHAAALAEEGRMPRETASSLTRAYDIYTKQGKHDMALQVSERVLTEYAAFLTPYDRLLQLRNMMNSQERLGNLQEAYRLQKMHTALNDSLHQEEITFKIHNLEQKYEAAKRENQIVTLNQHMKEQELSIQRSRFWAFALGATILLVVGVSVSGYMIFRKKQLIAAKESELLERKMEKLRQDQHISVFSAMLEGQEQERKRLAIDLHDGLGGSLSSIKMKLSKVVQAGNGTMSNGELPTVLRQLDASVDELRRIARNMMPETLLKYGLATALRDFCKSLEQDGTTISFQPYGLQKDMPKSIQIMVYRIVQELISNAIKHAKATQILAQCLQNGNQLSITVEDDGAGFDEASLKQPGMGLANVRTRVAYMGGKLDIHSEKGVGTTVNIELTYEAEQHAD